jgi:hypothetical protein
MEGYYNQPAHYTLTMSADRTFIVERFQGEKKEASHSGTWVGSGPKDNFSIMCLILVEGEAWTSGHHFTLTLLDDGRIAAISGASVAPFGAGSVVIFEKN